MRYSVRFVTDEKEIVSALDTDDYAEACKKEHELREEFGRHRAWIADAFMEMLVG